MAILVVAQWRIFYSLNPLLTKLVFMWQTAQTRTGNLLFTDNNPTLMQSKRGSLEPPADHGRRPLCQSNLGCGPLVWPSRWWLCGGCE